MSNQPLINLEYEKPIALNQIGEYGESLNRNILAKTDTARIVHLSLDEGYVLAPHPAPGDGIVQVVEGEIEFTISDVPHRMKTGEAIVMAAGAVHAVKAFVPSKIIVTAITQA